MKTLKVGDKVKIPKKCNSCLTNFKDFLEEIIGYKLDYLVVDKVKDKSNGWQVGLERDDGVVLIDDAFMFEDLEHYEEYNETFNPEAHSSLIIDFDKHELLLTEAIESNKVETIEEYLNREYPDKGYDEEYYCDINLDIIKPHALQVALSDTVKNYWFKIFQEEQKGQNKHHKN